MLKKKIRLLSLSTSGASMLSLGITFLVAFMIAQNEIKELYLNNPWFNFFVTAFLSTFVSVFLPFFFMKKIYDKKRPVLKKYNYTKKISFKESTKWVFFGCFAVLVLNIFNGLFAQFLNQQGYIDKTMDSFNLDSPLSIFLVFVTVCIIAPIFEELTFRWCLFDVVRKEGNAFGIIFSSLFFGLLHGNFYQMLFGALVGCVLSFIVVKTENIFITIVIHMINNSFAIFALFINSKYQNIVLIILTVLFSVIIISGCFSVKILRKNNQLNLKDCLSILKKQNKLVYYYYLIPFFLIPFITYVGIGSIK